MFKVDKGLILDDGDEEIAQDGMAPAIYGSKSIFSFLSYELYSFLFDFDLL